MTILLVVLLLLALPGGELQGNGQAGAVAPGPDFSGKWINESASPAGTSVRSQWSSPVTITQDARTITIEYVSYSRSHASVKLVYNLDGSVSKGIDCNSGPSDLVLRAEWRDRRLRLSTTYLRANYGNMEIIEVLALDSPATMTIDITRKVGDQTLVGSSRWRR